MQISCVRELPLGSAFSYLRQEPCPGSPWKLCGEAVQSISLDEVALKGKFITDQNHLRKFLGLNGPEAMNGVCSSDGLNSVVKFLEENQGPKFDSSGQVGLKSGVSYYLRVSIEKLSKVFTSNCQKWDPEMNLSDAEFSSRFGDSYVSKIIYGPNAYFRVKFDRSSKFSDHQIKTALKNALTLIGNRLKDRNIDNHNNNNDLSANDSYILSSIPYRISMISNLTGLKTPQTIEEMMNLALYFPTKTKSKSFPPLRIMVKPYCDISQSISGSKSILNDANSVNHYINTILADKFIAFHDWELKLNHVSASPRSYSISDEHRQEIEQLRGKLVNEQIGISNWLKKCNIGEYSNPPQIQSLFSLFDQYPSIKDLLMKSYRGMNSLSTSTIEVLTQRNNPQSASAVVATPKYPVLRPREDNQVSILASSKYPPEVSSRDLIRDESLENICIEVVKNGQSQMYKIPTQKPLEVLMNGFCSRENVSNHEISFFWNGQTINCQQTPIQLGMQNGDKIFANPNNLMISEVPLNPHYPPVKVGRASSSDAGEKFLIAVTPPDGQRPIGFHVDNHTKMEDIFQNFACQMKISPNDLTFLHKGNPLSVHYCVGDLDLSSRSVINAIRKNPHNSAQMRITAPESLHGYAAGHDAGAAGGSPSRGEPYGQFEPYGRRHEDAGAVAGASPAYTHNPYGQLTRHTSEFQKNPFFLRVKTHHGDLAIFKVLSTTPLAEVMRTLHQQENRPLSLMFNGSGLNPHHSVGQAGIRSEDVIFAV